MGVLWYIVGFSLVFGDSLGGFIGSPATNPALQGVPHNGCIGDQHIPGLAYATFEMMFASITPLLMTGAFAERLLWKPYLLFIILWEILVYYPCAHWIWGNGWLAQRGVLDFAGGIVIHTSAGAGALVSAVLVHPRLGFTESHGHFEPSNIPLACVGGAFLWMGWFGFNAGSALSSTFVASTVVANTQIASSACAAVWLVCASIYGRPNVEDILNGAIAGLAGITPAAGYISPLASMILGLVLGLASYFSVGLIKFRLHIDDALDVSSVHGVPGVVGALAIGFAAERLYNPAVSHEGVFISGSWILLANQLLAIVVVAAWSAVWTYLIFKAIHACMPISTRHMDQHGEVWLDELEHECAAYGADGHHWVGPNHKHTDERQRFGLDQPLLLNA
jgi:Amt family ammonium transporter